MKKKVALEPVFISPYTDHSLFSGPASSTITGALASERNLAGY
jgi:hypothetical protein